MDFRGNDERSLDSNIDSSLSLNPPTVSPVLDHHLETNPGAISEKSLVFLKEAAAAFSQTSSVPSPSDTSPAVSPSYTPARLFQATGDVRHLARSEASLSGFTVQIYDRHTHTWISDINFSDIAIRAQIYILWKTAWLEMLSHPIDREIIFDATALTWADIQKDNKKWERNYSAARRREWHPNFTSFYDGVFKSSWIQRAWYSIGKLPEPP